MSKVLVPQSKVVFLFGAGVSRIAGMPSTNQITSQILSADNAFRATDGNYYIEGPIQVDGRKLIPVILHYLSILGTYIERHFSGKDKILNYEDYYYLARQISDCLDEEVENPGLGPLLSQIQTEGHLINLLNQAERSFHELANEACNYILDLTAMMLSSKNSDLTYLKFLDDASKDPEIEQMDIFTLNHDTVLDQYFQEAGIEIADGFEGAIHNLRWWNTRVYRFGSPRVRIFKLHGAVNWYRMQQDPDIVDLGRVAIVLDGDHWHSRNKDGKLVMSIQHRPLILAGTFNKIMEYSTGIFADTFAYFLGSLRETNVVIISGYSFGDKGINTALVEWMYSNTVNQIILIHKDLNGLKKTARRAVASKIDHWILSNRLVHLEKWVEEVTWAEISASLPGRF